MRREDTGISVPAFSLLGTPINTSQFTLSKTARAWKTEQCAYGHESNVAGSAKSKHNGERETVCQGISF